MTSALFEIWAGIILTLFWSAILWFRVRWRVGVIYLYSNINHPQKKERFFHCAHWVVRLSLPFSFLPCLKTWIGLLSVFEISSPILLNLYILSQLKLFVTSFDYFDLFLLLFWFNLFKITHGSRIKIVKVMPLTLLLPVFVWLKKILEVTSYMLSWRLCDIFFPKNFYSRFDLEEL